MSQKINSTVQQTTDVHYVVPVTVTVHLDKDPQFTGFTDTERQRAITTLVKGLLVLMSGSERVDFTSGEATEVVA